MGIEWSKYFSYRKGKLINKIRRGTSLKGQEAGCNRKDGYRVLTFKGKTRYAHRIIWEIEKGEIPKDKNIDHINGNPSDNRIENLRLVTQQENMFNTRARGTTYNKRSRKYMSRIKIDGKQIHLGYFSTEEEAHQKYLEHKTKIHRILTR
jgi:hypothetical protein